MGRNKRVESGTGSNVNNAFAFREGSKRKWVRNAGERLHGHVRERVDEVVIISEPSCQIAAGVEMKRSVRIGRYLSILTLDFLPQCVGVDSNLDLRIIAHRSFSSTVPKI